MANKQKKENIKTLSEAILNLMNQVAENALERQDSIYGLVSSHSIEKEYKLQSKLEVAIEDLVDSL